jgi:23S rRNA pseudouridine2605 synthase
MNPDRLSFPMRLNRYMAVCGISSRRKADEMISSGRVMVGGIVESSLGRTLSGAEEVLVDGRPISAARPAYIVMNKPRGVLSAVTDSRGKTVVDLLPGSLRGLGLFPAGRLDMDSEGLIILTNDGQFAQRIIHPSSRVRKTYIVFLKEVMDRKGMMEWTRGVMIDGKLAVPLEISPARGGDDGRRWRIVLGEGFKREIRLMARAAGNRVLRLKRIGIGGLFLKKLPSGMFCEYNYLNLWKMISNGGEI